jgi:asparaginyl-tRNA synthetase
LCALSVRKAAAFSGPRRLSVVALLAGRPAAVAVRNPLCCRASTTTSSTMMPSNLVVRTKIRHLLSGQTTTNNNDFVGQTVKVQGWVRTVRDQKLFSFIEVNDGSQLQGLQVIADASLPSYGDVSKCTTGASVEVVGQLVRSAGKGQSLELHASSVRLIGACPAESYPLQKKRHSQEFLRGIAHLRARTNTISAVARIRSQLAAATHSFFQQEGFVYLQSPLITASDCEGAGEMFRVTTLPIDRPQQIPLQRPQPTTATVAGTATDFSQDFFGKPAFLTVSGQLSGETYACAMGDVYTFGPTFRAEKSATTRHLAEFW